VVGRVVLVGWLLALSAVLLYVFFVGLAGVAPGDIAIVTGVVALLALLYAIRTLRLAHELGDRAGDPELRADRNRARERRGF
jgi:hypothetical protein